MHGVIFQTQMLRALKPTTVSFIPLQQQPTFLSLLVSLIEHAQQHLTESKTSDNENEDATQTEEHEDWMLLCRLNYCYANDTTSQHDSIDRG